MIRALLTLGAATLYATLRYNVCKGVPWGDWPSYTLNKGFALAALLIIATELLLRRRGRDGRGAWTAAGAFMLIHAALSFVLLRPAHYAGCFEADGRLGVAAGCSMLFGALAFAGLHLLLRTCNDRGRASWAPQVGALAFLSGLHAALLGYAGWFDPSTWPGHLLPITLISFVAGSAALVFSLRGRPGR